MPWLLDRLLQNLDFDLEQVADVIDPILTAQHYCRSTGLYVQGMVVGDRSFLTSNVPDRTIRITGCGQRWLLGTHPDCGIAIPAEGIAPFHAALDFDPQKGFSLTALGEIARTQVNGRPLLPLRPCGLQEGDRLQLGQIEIEFLQEFCPVYTWHPDFAPEF